MATERLDPRIPAKQLGPLYALVLWFLGIALIAIIVSIALFIMTDRDAPATLFTLAATIAGGLLGVLMPAVAGGSGDSGGGGGGGAAGG